MCSCCADVCDRRGVKYRDIICTIQLKAATNITLTMPITSGLCVEGIKALQKWPAFWICEETTPARILYGAALLGACQPPLPFVGVAPCSISFWWTVKLAIRMAARHVLSALVVAMFFYCAALLPFGKSTVKTNIAGFSQSPGLMRPPCQCVQPLTENVPVRHSAGNCRWSSSNCANALTEHLWKKLLVSRPAPVMSNERC